MSGPERRVPPGRGGDARRTLRLGVPLLLAFSTPGFTHGDPDERMRHADERIAHAPDDPRLWLERGALRREHGDHAGALRDLRRAAAVPATAARAELQLARVLVETGEHARALEHVERVLRAMPEEPMTRRLRAEAHAALGDHRAAIDDYGWLIDRAATPRPELVLARARAIRALGPEHLDAAVASLREVLSRGAPLLLLEQEIVALYREAGRHAEALAALEGIIERQSRPERWYRLRGDLLAERGERVAARGSYRAALAAIEALPPARADVPAMRTLRAALLARLDAP